MMFKKSQIVVAAIAAIAVVSILLLPLIAISQEGFAPLQKSPLPRGEIVRPAVPPGGVTPLVARFSFPAAVSARPGVLTVYSSPSCLPCLAMQRDVGNGGEGLAVVWTHEPIPEIVVTNEARQGRTTMLPCTVWAVDGRTRYLVGRHTLAQLRSSYEQTLPATETGEPPVGNLSGLDLRSVIDRLAGLGITSARIVWRRDTPTSLVVGQAWQLTDVIGPRGGLSVDVVGPAWPIKAASFTYVFDGESLTLDAGPITIPVRSVGASGDRVTGDPLTIAFGAISLIRMLLPILSPTISIELPRELDIALAVKPDSVHVAFADGPAVSIRSIITLRRKLTGVSITPRAVVAEFNQSRWWKRITILSGE